MDIKNNYTVYMHISPSNKRYIGITCQEPSRRWANGKGYPCNKHFTNAINKYGWDNFEHIIIAKGLTEDEAKWLEIELIREWDSTNPNKGYNITLGGDGTTGLKHTEEFKQEQSERVKGESNPFYGVHKYGEDNPMFGKSHTEEAKQKIREANLGRKLSEETKQKLSEIRRGENHPMFGKHLSEEHKIRIGEGNSGKIRTEETKQKIRDNAINNPNFGMKGKQHTEETKQKISEANSGRYFGENNPMFGVHRYGEEAPMFGKTHTEETKQKIRETKMGENNPNAKAIILLNTKEVFSTITEGAKKYNCDVSGVTKCCKGKSKSCGKHPITNEKLIWMYYENYLKLIDKK